MADDVLSREELMQAQAEHEVGFRIVDSHEALREQLEAAQEREKALVALGSAWLDGDNGPEFTHRILYRMCVVLGLDDDPGVPQEMEHQERSSA